MDLVFFTAMGPGLSKLSGTCVKVAQSCLTLWPHGLYRPWNSSDQNTEWLAVPFSRGSSQPRDQIQVSCIAGRYFTIWATRETLAPDSFFVFCCLLTLIVSWQNAKKTFAKQSCNLWRRQWHPTPVLLPGEFHGQRSLEGYSPWGHKESDMTEWLTHTHIRG